MDTIENIRTFQDDDLSKEARAFRWNQYLSLKQLPYYTPNQAKRLNQLMRLRKRDNHFAFSEDIKNS